MRPRTARKTVSVAVVLTCAAAGLSGCATYIDRMSAASLATSAGNYESALADMNSALGVSSADELPSQWSGDRPLAALERGMLQQSLTQYRGAARDLSGAEQQLELLDLRVDAIGALGSYLYSDSAKTYKTPPSERLALNAINLLNYLAIYDFEGAAVEARRFQVMRDYLDAENIKADGPATLGTYLAGFLFEHRGESERALRYYDEALTRGRLETLVPAVRRLARNSSYRGKQLSQLLKDSGGPSGTKPERELLVIVSAGRVPHKEPRRIPVGAAVGIAGTVISGSGDFLKYGAAKVVVYPELVDTPSTLGNAAVQVDGTDVGIEQIVDLGAAIRTEYDEAKPKIMAAALTRMAARAGVAEGVRAAGKAESGVLGDVLSIVVESAMVALDRPDTRSWTTMPARVLAARLPITPGTHEIVVKFSGGITRTMTVDASQPGAFIVVITEPM